MAILKLLRSFSAVRDPPTLAASSETVSNHQGGDLQPFTTLRRWIPKRSKTRFDGGKVELAQVSVTPVDCWHLSLRFTHHELIFLGF